MTARDRQGRRGWLGRGRATCSAAAVVLAIGCSGTPRGACDPNPQIGVVGSICGFQGPEDVEVVESAGLLLVSDSGISEGASEGRIVAVVLAPVPMAAPRTLWPASAERGETSTIENGSPAGEPECRRPPERFTPHGITAVPGSSQGIVRVAVVGHGSREAIEFFDLAGSGDAARMVWRGCVPLPPDTSGNDLAVAPDGEIVVSNYLSAPAKSRPFANFFLTITGGLLGRPTGDLIAWRKDRGWRHLDGTVAALPNGVAVSEDGSTVYFAETGTGRISRIAREAPRGTKPRSVEIGGMPDNLSWTPRKTLLAATHTDTGSLMLCASFGRRPCRAGWSLFEIDPGTFEATKLLHHDGRAVGSVASAASHGERIYFGAVFGDRIGVWRPALLAPDS